MSKHIPEATKEKFVAATTAFIAKTGASADTVTDFVVEILRIHNEYIDQTQWKVKKVS